MMTAAKMWSPLVTEGPASVLDIKSDKEFRVTPFNPRKEPDYPAIMFYVPVTDDAFWVECDDPYTIHLAEKKNEEAIRLASSHPRPKSLSEVANVWAAKLFLRLNYNAIRTKYTDPVSEGARIGYQIRIGDVMRIATTQLHVDWSGEDEAEIDLAIDQLADGIAKRLGPRKELYSLQLWCPKNGAEGVLLDAFDMRGRAIRCINCSYKSIGEIRNVFPMTRIDVLFPVF